MNPDDYAQTHAKSFPAGKGWAATVFRTYFDRATTIVGGDAQSFVLGTVILDEAEILTVATDPAVQRQGKARAALRDFVNHADARNVTRVFLEVAADNAPALALYAQAGFAQTSIRKGYYRRANAPNCDAIVMQLKLPLR